MAFLGFFWYDEKRRELFGVFKRPENEIEISHTGEQVFPILHKDVWQGLRDKYYDRFGRYIVDDRYPIEEENPFSEPDYTLVPRGRVTGMPNDYRILHGDWLYGDEERIKQLILEEFNIDPIDAVFQHDEHWDLGNGWGE